MPSKHPKFSLNTLENYQFVNGVVLEVVQELFPLSEPAILIEQSAPSLGPNCHHFCMAKPTQYDVVYQGLKIAGSAQRRRKQGYLHQGTISLLAPNVQLLEEVLLFKEDVLTAMQSFTFSPLGQDVARLEVLRPQLQNLLADKLKQALRF